jgi:integrase
MARRAIDYALHSKTARAKLAPRPKPYYRQIAPGVTLGYFRKDSGPGSWQVRELVAGDYRYRTIAAADDVGRADGRDILTFEQAQAKATASEPTATKPAGKLTVAHTLDAYLTVLEGRGTYAKDTRQRADKHIIPVLGNIRVDRLTKTQIEEWLAGLVRDDPDDSDARRRSQDTANRVLTIFKAALNLAFSDESNGIPTDAAWRRVKPFKAVGGAREDHFDATQVRRLIAKAADTDRAFANLIEAGYLTGARYGELVALDVRDFDAARSLLIVTKGKTGARIVSLTAESVGFFGRVTKDRPPAAVLLPRADGARWGKSWQARPFKGAAKAAELPASASFYTLRHSYISRAIESGMPLSLLAENCGTSLAMIQKNYAKVLASTRGAFVEATSPKLRRVK